MKSRSQMSILLWIQERGIRMCNLRAGQERSRSSVFTFFEDAETFFLPQFKFECRLRTGIPLVLMLPFR